MRELNLKGGLLSSTTLCGVALLTALSAFSTPAAAQTATSAKEDAKKKDSVTEVVVTGSIIRRKNASSISPVTVLSSDDLEKRGVTTVEAAVQSLAANNSGALPNSFTANGAFAAGASAASLRGLSTSSTLTLFDGLRGAYYPLADDGSRNFVDLNSIPDAIIDRIEVLQDGASSTYGADAIGGVINIITKKQIKGLHFSLSAGTSEKGGGDKKNASVAWGKGDLGTDGFNFYLAGEYQKDSELRNSQRGYPYNTSDLSKLCSTDWTTTPKCGLDSISNDVLNGVYQGVGTFTTVALVRPYNATNTTAKGLYQNISSNVVCPQGQTSHTLTQPELDAYKAQFGSAATIAAGTTVCQIDTKKLYGIIMPQDTRFSLSGRVTKRFSDGSEAWLEANYYQNKTLYTATPATIRASAPPALGVSRYISTSIALPVYVCAARVNCNATNGTLNPNNPFAAQGNVARILYYANDIERSNATDSKTYRLAGGIKGTLWDDWKYEANFVSTGSDLVLTKKGYVYIQHMLDVIADGTYNFVDPSKNSQAVRDYLTPTSIQKTSSWLNMAQFDLSKGLFELPGGQVQMGLSASARGEGVMDPSANSFAGGPTEGYFIINSFYSRGKRTVLSGAAEFDLPVLPKLDVNLSARYDNYSTGQNAVSPKIGARWKATDILTFRGTYSNGFRIPSIAEQNSAKTGYVTVSAPASFIAAHGGNTYGKSYSLGVTTIGNPNLQPEKSTNTLLGFVLTPNKDFSFSMDYFNIQKNKVIAPGKYSNAVAAYYAGTPIPAGFTIIPDVADPNFPNAQPRIGFVLTPFDNQNRQVVSGFDYNASLRTSLLDGKIQWTSTATATYIGKFNQIYADGSVDHYAGSSGPYDPTADSGTPKLRGNWQNTFKMGKTTLSATAYYTSGYSGTAEDAGDTLGDCATSSVVTVVCNVKSFVYFDAHADYAVTPNYTVTLDVSNLFGTKAPLDTTTYGGYNYNPAWGGAGVIGRYWRVGVKGNF